MQQDLGALGLLRNNGQVVCEENGNKPSALMKEGNITFCSVNGVGAFKEDFFSVYED